MRQYLMLLLGRQRGRNALVASGFLFAACMLILLSATTQATVVRAGQIISQNWRPTYDIVVLPPQANIPAGTAVPADLLEGYNGGISMAQYEQVKRISGVEVAAPIAFIGYVSIPSPDIQFSSQSLAPGYWRLNWTLTAFNGQQQIVERQLSLYYWIGSRCDELNNTVLDQLARQRVEFAGCGDNEGPNIFPSMDTGTYLLAAIDPQAEDQLVHLGRSVVSGRMLTESDTLQLDAKYPQLQLGPDKAVPNYRVPMLFHQELPGQIGLSVQVTRVAGQPLSPSDVLAKGGFAYLAQQPNEPPLYDGSVPLVQNDPTRFSQSILARDSGNWQVQRYSDKSGSMLFLYNPSGLTYQPAIAPDGQSTPAYSLVPSPQQNTRALLQGLPFSQLLPQGEDALIPDGAQGPEVAFRTQSPLRIGTSGANVTAVYDPLPVGQFTDASLAAQFSDALNWLPETTYAAPPTILKYDAQGRPVTPTQLLPTTNPSGFMLQPPLAFTTLQAARQMKGNQLISVIRVRVSGVEGANNESWKRIEQVAAQIQQQTGLRALVTLGSSPQPTLVYVPGLKQGRSGSTHDIAPLGWVEERWIAIGAAVVYLNQFATTHLLLLAAILLVCLGYLAVMLNALLASQRRDWAILSALGWRPGFLARTFLAQAFVLALIGGTVGVGLALAISTMLGTSPPWEIVVWTPILVLGLGVLSVIYPLWQIGHIRPAEVFRQDSLPVSGRASRRSRRIGNIRRSWALTALASLATRNLMRARVRTMIAIGSIACSTILLIVMANQLLALQKTLRGTLLGNDVLLQTTAFQLAGALAALALTFLSVADLLLLQVRERRQEIGLLRAVGWRPRLIRRLFTDEGIVLALLGSIPGIVIALGAQIAQHQLVNVPTAVALAVGTLTIMALVAIGATFPAVRAANRIQVMDALRSE